MEFFLIINNHKFGYLKKENLMKKVNFNALREAGEKFCNGGDKKWNKSCTFATEWRMYIHLALIWLSLVFFDQLKVPGGHFKPKSKVIISC